MFIKMHGCKEHVRTVLSISPVSISQVSGVSRHVPSYFASPVSLSQVSGVDTFLIILLVPCQLVKCQASTRSILFCHIILLGCMLFCAFYDVIKLLLALLLLAFCTLRYKERTTGPVVIWRCNAFAK
jgi:hypothetical protein